MRIFKLKRWAFSGLLSTLLAVGLTTSFGASLDRIVAVVNDDIITQREVDTEVSRVMKGFERNHAPTPPLKEVQKEMLDQLINTKLQLQVAKRAGLKVTPKEVETALKGIAERNKISVDELTKKIAAEGFTFESFRKNLERQILLNNLQQQAVGGEVKLSEADVNHFLARLKKDMQQNTLLNSHFKILDILIRTPDAPTAEQQKEASDKANLILTRLTQNNHVQTAIEDQKDVELNDMEERPLGALPEVFIKPIVEQKERTFVGPIKAPNGYHILKILEQKAPPIQMPNPAQARQMAHQDKMQQEVKKWIEKIRAKAYVKINS